MKKKLLVASLLFITTSVMAESKYFIGAGVGVGSWTPSAVVTDSTGSEITTVSQSDSATALSLSGGAIINDMFKVSAAYSIYSTDEGVDVNSIELGCAYFIDQDMIGITNKKWKPFVGMGYSILNYKEKLPSGYEKSEFKLSSSSIMIGLGIDYNIDEHQFISAGYDMSISTSGHETTKLTINSNEYNVDMSVDKVSRFLMTYNYQF